MNVSHQAQILSSLEMSMFLKEAWATMVPQRHYSTAPTYLGGV
jgi:hypothetical protein